MPLKLSANPTFKAAIEVPTTDGPMKFTAVFKYKTRDEWNKYAAALKPEQLIEDVLCDVMVDWEDVDEPFTKKAVAKLANVHPGSMDAVYRQYITALTQGKLGN